MLGKTALACALAVSWCLATPARGEDVTAEVNRHLRTIERSDDPVERVQAVKRLGELPGTTIAARLAKVVRGDASPLVRSTAALSLGTCADPAAADELLALAAEGGPREVRRAIAQGLGARKVPLERIAERTGARGVDAFERERLVETLALSPDPLAAGHLERIATTGAPAHRLPALRGLFEHPVGRRIAPTVLAQLVPGMTDLDDVLAALDLAQRHGDATFDDVVAEGLRERKVPAIDRALEEALAWIEWRAVARQPSPEERVQPRLRFREDRVFVLHRGVEIPRFRDEVRAAFARADAGRVDLRVAIVAYRESTPSRAPDVVVMPFTRVLDVVETFFGTLSVQVRDPNGSGMAQAVEKALGGASWRWDADRAVVLLADGAPSAPQRIERGVAAHHLADAVRFGVVYYPSKKEDENPPPKALDRAARSAGGTLVVVPPEWGGIFGKSGKETNKDTGNKDGK